MTAKTINTAAQATAAKPGVHRAGNATGLYLKVEELGVTLMVLAFQAWRRATRDGPRIARRRQSL